MNIADTPRSMRSLSYWRTSRILAVSQAERSVWSLQSSCSRSWIADSRL